MLLLKGRWLAGHVLAFVVIVTFASLGFWQLARDREKQDIVRERRAAFAATAPDLEAAGDSVQTGDRVEARGTFDSEVNALLRNRVRNGDDGFDVLTPLLLDDGSAVIVDRGWIANGAVDDLGDPPSGAVVVRGLLRASRPLETDDAVREVEGMLSLPRVGAEELQREVSYDLHDTWIEAQSLDPVPSGDAPRLPEPPPPDQVNHYQYALQWFALAMVPLIGWPIVCWRAVRRKGS
jgi:cytochrome oxidase assembly protein ShyY1